VKRAAAFIFATSAFERRMFANDAD